MFKYILELFNKPIPEEKQYVYYDVLFNTLETSYAHPNLINSTENNRLVYVGEL